MAGTRNKVILACRRVSIFKTTKNEEDNSDPPSDVRGGRANDTKNELKLAKVR